MENSKTDITFNDFVRAMIERQKQFLILLTIQNHRKDSLKSLGLRYIRLLFTLIRALSGILIWKVVQRLPFMKMDSQYSNILVL
jgi:hypothetical protein